ncbi:MAG: glycosyltransferase family 39 protein, partial [Chloroflexi bacterium]|nr:glycosyltransferase family 39 protein [Chloroflexota bacterium]
MARRPWLMWYVIALVPRLLAAILGRNMGIGLDDMFQYDMLARSLAAGQGFRWYAIEDVRLIQRYVDFDPATHPQYDPRGLRTSFRAPLYPAFLAVVYRLSGFDARFAAARVAQALITAVVAPLTWWIARRLIPARPWAAHAAAAVVSLYPMLVLLPLALATENLFLPLSLALFAWLLRGPGTQPRRWAALAGGLMVLVLLTRSVSAVFVPVVAWRAWRGPRGRQATAIFLTVVFLGIGPWLLRNRALHGRWVWLETSGGYNLYIGYHPDGDGTFYP